MSSGPTKNVVKASDGLAGALAEAKAFKVANQADYIHAKDAGNAKDWTRSVCQADAAEVAASTPRVSVVLTGLDKGLEIGGKLHTWDSLQDAGLISDGDVVVLHYLGSYLRKVAASVGVSS